MSARSYTLSPDLFLARQHAVQVTVLPEAVITANVLDAFISTCSNKVIGVTASYGTKGVLRGVVFSTEHQVLHVRLPVRPPKSAKSFEGRHLLRNKLLCNRKYRKLSLDAERVSTALFFDHQLRITGLMDAQSLLVTEKRWSTATVLQLLGSEGGMNTAAVRRLFNKTSKEKDTDENLALHAWATWTMSVVLDNIDALDRSTKINTWMLKADVLSIVAKCVRDADQLEAMKPTKVRNDVKTKFHQKSDVLQVELTRFKTRARTGDNLRIVVETSIAGQDPVNIAGKVKKVRGKMATVNLSLSKQDAAVAKVHHFYTVGREDPTPAEVARVEAILRVLTGDSALFSQSLARRIFLGEMFPTHQSPPLSTPKITTTRQLNASQKKAVRSILSSDPAKVVCLVQGPPGTGKTSVIAAAVTSIAASPDPPGTWLMAQSNVAVKNIAKKLLDVEFLEFALLVSHDFHFEWHEHLYKEALEERLIRSSDFKDDILDTQTLLKGSKVILCTLSMISNPRIRTSGFDRLVPVETVIVDEASQIEVGDYLPLLAQFQQTIKKLAFIGDDKQLAPYGQDDLSTLRSIFEMEHMRKDAVFLDTQYRMPHPIGNFLSKRVYKGRLKSQHGITDRSCCMFVDIAQGTEVNSGHSFTNTEEANAVIHIVRHYVEQGKIYRIVTPYDAQRTLLETMLKSAGLPWEDRCFNVDSFQGMSGIETRALASFVPTFAS
ncbi:P-loop containing nucleoside triphosphate hydrolase protein [Trametopsis cervina]|nr:P-loop containing nucleoside triphosphate hydrolase protein [Trametopsis cervina]